MILLSIVPLWQPGKIIHIYSYSGVYLASEVKRTFPEIRRIEIQGNIFTDHSSEKIFEALKEVKSVRRAEACKRYYSYEYSSI